MLNTCCDFILQEGDDQMAPKTMNNLIYVFEVTSELYFHILRYTSFYQLDYMVFLNWMHFQDFYIYEYVCLYSMYTV